MRTCLFRRCAWALLLLPVSSAQGQSLAETYAAVLRPKINQVAVIENVGFNWDAYHIQLRRGTLALTAAVEGRVVSAVFVGDGEIDLSPSDAVERQQLTLFTGKPALAEPMTQAVFRFADERILLAALADQVHFHATDEQRPYSGILEARAKTIEHDGLPEAARIVESLDAPLDSPTAGKLLYLEAYVGRGLLVEDGWIEAELDPLQPDSLRVHHWAQRSVHNAWSGLRRIENFDPVAATLPAAESDRATMGCKVADCIAMADLWLDADPNNLGDRTITGFDDTWTAFPAQGGRAAAPPARLDDYRLAVTVGSAGDLAGNLVLSVAGEAQLTRPADWGRGVLLELDSNLRLASAGAGGEAAPWLQPRDPGDLRDPGFIGNWIYLRLPAAAAGTVTLQLEYAGKNAIQRAGRDDYYLRSTEWFPRIPFPPLLPASFHLSFSTTRKETIVSEGGAASWSSPEPTVSVGFALGKFTVRSRPAGVGDDAFQVQVFAEQQGSNLLESANLKETLWPQPVNSQNFADRPRPLTGVTLCGGRNGIGACRPIGSLAAGTGANRVLNEAENAARFLAVYLGPYPYNELTVVSRPDPGIDAERLTSRVAGVAGPQVETLGLDGPHWGPLVGLSEIGFLDDTQLHELGIVYTVHRDPRDAEPDLTRQIEETLEAHSIAHAWFDGQVGAATPRDQWIAEGIAQIAALVYEEGRFGVSHARDTLTQWRTELTSHDQFDQVPINTGPVTLGARLASSKDPNGYETVVYDKSGYILEMLRALMARPVGAGSNNSDAGFIALLHDFIETYRGRQATTEDFQHTVERHMNALMDVNGDGSMDWFFDTWVTNSGQPHLGFQSRTTIQADGKVSAEITITNPSGWHGVAPVDVLGLDGTWSTAWIKLAGAETRARLELEGPPRAIEPDHFHRLLVDFRQP